MDYACLVRKICGYYSTGVYVQIIRSTTRRYFRGQHGPVLWRLCSIGALNQPNPVLAVRKALYCQKRNASIRWKDSV